MTETNKKKRISKSERNEFDKLCEYIRINVMNYSEKQKLSPNMCDRIKKLSLDTGYSYEIILAAYKYSMFELKNKISKMTFETGNKKFNYVFAVVLNNIDDISNKIRKEELACSQFENLNDFSCLFNSQAKYQHKTGECPKGCEDMWVKH